MADRTAFATALFALFAAPAMANQPILVDLVANDIAYNSQTGMLYAAVASTDGVTYGNRLVEISPVDGSITRSVFIGSEPYRIGMSPDAAVAFVGLSGAPTVYPVDLNTMTPGTGFSLGNDSFTGPRYANDIAVMAGMPGTVAISRRNHGYSPSFEGLAIYDNGVARPVEDNSFTGGNSIAFGASTSTLYGYTNETSDFTLERLTVDASGVAIASSASNVISGYGVVIKTSGDTIFATNGAVVDGTQLQLIGTFSIPGTFADAMALDDSTSSVFFAQYNNIYAFDRATYLPGESLTVPASGFPIAATQCGTPGCMAIAYDSGQIFIVPDVLHIFKDGFE